MIVELTVENVAIIERSQLSLGSGFTVLTGETGAGKSLLIDAIELVLGERADSDLVRSGASRAVVAAVFDLSRRPELLAKCAELGLYLEDGSLYVQREVFAEGRSQCRVAGKLAPVGALRSLGQLLVDLHGQHDHQSLLHPDRHGEFLDLWIGPPAQDLIAKVKESYSAWTEANGKLTALRRGVRDREQRFDMLDYQVREIETVSPKAGEMDELEIALSRLQNSEKLALAAQGSLQKLSDEEGSAYDRLGEAVRNLEELTRLDSSLQSTVEPLKSALYTFEDGLRELRRYTDGLESDPAILEETAARIDDLRRLRRKYGEDEAAILLFLAEARAELELLADAETNEADLEQKALAARETLERAAKDLTALRTAKSSEFSHEVQSELHELAMEKAHFDARVGEKPIDEFGSDRIEFFFSANAGEESRALAKIASGGEMSRVMLAIKTVLAGKAGVPTLIFDEVDAGLSGRAAATVARKLEGLANHYQVITISHLPQIASRATAHFRIEKTEAGGRVITDVRHLKPDERVEEIARMLAGETVTDFALANAREMLAR